MFKYNELSDLKNGSLVVPLSIEDDGTILCLTEENQKVYHLFDDFDFSKKIEDRVVPEPIPEPIPEPKPTIKDVIDKMAEDEDDSLYDGTDDTEIFDENPVTPKPIISNEKEGFISKEKIPEILDRFELKNSISNCSIWRDTISTKTKNIKEKLKNKKFKDEQNSTYTFNKDATEVDMTYSAGIAKFNILLDENKKIITLLPIEYIYSENEMKYKYYQIVGGFNLTRIKKEEGYPLKIKLEEIQGE